MEGVYVKDASPAFCLLLYLVGVNFQGKLQHGGDVSKKSSVDQSSCWMYYETCKVEGLGLYGNLMFSR